MKSGASLASRASQMSSAMSVLSLLEEEDDALKYYALQQLDRSVHDVWFQMGTFISTVEALYEDEEFPHRQLAALVASKVFYYLDDLDEAVTYALNAGPLFDVSLNSSDYVQTVLARCLDNYIELRQKDPDQTVDAEMSGIFQRLFDRCVADGQAEQAVGIALETRRLDCLETAILKASNPQKVLKYALEMAEWNLPAASSFKESCLRLFVRLYNDLPADTGKDYIAICRCLLTLGDAPAVASIVESLLLADEDGDESNSLLAYQIGFDLVHAEESSRSAFISAVREALASKFNKSHQNVDREEEKGEMEKEAMIMDTEGAGSELPPNKLPTGPTAKWRKFNSIVSGEVPIELERRFLTECNASDLLILKNIKMSVEARNSVCHGATVFANAVMHAGTCVDTFLRENLDWLAKATNWAKFSATAGMGVIHRGNLTQGKRVLSPYLPSAPGATTSSPYSEGGALYAMGLIHVNRGGDEEVKKLLLDSLKNGTQNEVVQHGACLGLGIAGLGSGDVEAFEEIKNVLYTDSAVAGEASGIALGLLFAGTGTDRAEEMLAYAHDTQHEKIIRGLTMGLAIIQYGRAEAADTQIEAMTRDQDPLVRYGGMFTIGLAYCGTASNAAVAKLLHFAVSDVSNDVRRAAVMNLGFVLASISHPERCVRTVALLAEGYNPHVRYGAAIAVGIAAAGTGSREAVALLSPMLRDSVDFVQQGALIASALVLVQQPEVRQRELRERISHLHGNRGAELMARMGSIMAAGLLDVGGRNVTLGVLLPGGGAHQGRRRRSGAIGLALFLQYWYWYPMAYAISLSVSPTALIGVDATLRAPAGFAVRCNTKPSAFAYPQPLSAEDVKAKTKVPTAVLSTTARALARAAQKKDKGKEKEKREGGVGTTSKKGDVTMEEAEEAPILANGTDVKEGKEAKKEAKEPNTYVLKNPARVVPGQRRFISFFLEGEGQQRWTPVKAAPSGFLVLKDSQPGEAVEYLFAPEEEKDKEKDKEKQEEQGGTAQGTTAPPHGPGEEGDEPPPPEPFEYVPS